MVKGLARLQSCSHHDRKVKYVDASPFHGRKGGYSPMTAASLATVGSEVHGRGADRRLSAVIFG